MLAVLVACLMMGVSFVSGETVNKKKVPYYKELVLDPNRTVFIYGEIRDDMITEAINGMVDMEAMDANAPIYVVINSPGGYVDAGWRFINALGAIKAPVIGVIDVKAYSMAAIISIYFKTIYIMHSADIMFHEAGFCVCGQETINASRVEESQRYLYQMHLKIAAQLGLDFETYKKKIQAEWWLLPEDSYKANITDGIIINLKYKYVPPQSQFVILTGDDDGNDELPDSVIGGLFYGTNRPNNCHIVINGLQK